MLNVGWDENEDDQAEVKLAGLQKEGPFKFQTKDQQLRYIKFAYLALSKQTDQKIVIDLINMDEDISR